MQLELEYFPRGRDCERETPARGPLSGPPTDPSARPAMPIEILMPSTGGDMTEGNIARWAVKPGDAVRKDAVLLEIETDKALVEVPAPGDGVLAAHRPSLPPSRAPLREARPGPRPRPR